MARWLLRSTHYLRTIPPTYFDYKEQDADTGESNQQRFEVPRELPSGRIVCREGSKKDRSDIVFVGDPTPDMDPLDAEAEEETAAFQQQWGQQFVNMGDEGMAGAALREIADTLTAFKATVAPAAQVPNAEVEQLKGQIAAMQAMLTAAFAEKVEERGRRV